MYLHSPFLQILSGSAYLGLCALLITLSAQHKLKRIISQILKGAEHTEYAPNKSADKNDGFNTKAEPASSCTRPYSLIFCVVLFAFTCIPCGTLPSLFSTGAEGLIVLAILALSARFTRNAFATIKRAQGWCLVCFMLIQALFAWYALQRGIPGELFSLDTYVAFPLISSMGNYGKIGVLFLAATSLMALLSVQKNIAALYTRLSHSNQNNLLCQALVYEAWLMVAIAIWICFFVPYSPSNLTGVQAHVGAIVDVITFWIKVLGLNYILWIAKDRLPTHAYITVSLGMIGSIAVLLE